MARASQCLVIILLALSMPWDVADAVSSAAKGSSPGLPDSQVNLLEIPQPDLARADLPVQIQVRAAEEALAAILHQPDASDARRAKAFGNLGQISQAYGFDDAAVACYTNAARLEPQSFRWQYYIGYLHQKGGDLGLAARDYQRALALKPKDGYAMLRLGNVELDLSHLELAKSWFGNPAAQREAPAAAMTGLGKVAFIEHQYQAALKYFAEAMALEPQASSIHYQLAMTYRALGDLRQMEVNLHARGDVEPTIHDPLLDEIDAMKLGRVNLLARGNTALQENRLPDAVAAYRQLVGLDPSAPIGYIYLAAALEKSGQRNEALEQYAHALRLDPHNAAAHFNIGSLLTEAGNDEGAITHFREAIRFDPERVEAHFQLANLLMRRGKDDEAGREYGIVVSVERQNGFARLMQAMAAVHAGEYAQALSLLEAASLVLPKDPDIANALARILAAAPDPGVRNETRALRAIQTLVQSEHGLDLEKGITLAMALAGVGRFEEAAAVQRAMIHQLEEMGRPDLARRLRKDLALYSQNEPCRTPWASDDPIFTPVFENKQLPLK